MATGEPGHNPHAFTAHERVHGTRRRSSSKSDRKHAREFGPPEKTDHPKGPHIPGPWRVLVVYHTKHKHTRATVCTPYTYAPDGTGIPEQHIADCGQDFGDDGLSRANARLISAAPELLTACAELIRHFCGSTDKMPPEANRWFRFALAAIAKAKGAAR